MVSFVDWEKVSVIHWGLASRNHLFRKIYMGWNNVKNVLSILSACEHSKNHSTPFSTKTRGKKIPFCCFTLTEEWWLLYNRELMLSAYYLSQVKSKWTRDPKKTIQYTKWRAKNFIYFTVVMYRSVFNCF